MKLLLDENIGPIVAKELRERDFDVKSILEINPGVDDDKVLRLAVRERRVLVTLDRDFGRFVFLEAKSHTGVVYLRLARESQENILRILISLFDQYAGKIEDHFITATEDSVKIR